MQMWPEGPRHRHIISFMYPCKNHIIIVHAGIFVLHNAHLHGTCTLSSKGQLGQDFEMGAVAPPSLHICRTSLGLAVGGTIMIISQGGDGSEMRQV